MHTELPVEFPGDSAYSTDDFLHTTFRPHGRVESRISGNLFVQVAIGPFNKEILSAMRAVHGGPREILASRGPWGGILIFKHSALASMDMLTELTRYLAAQVKDGQASAATALVVGPHVEGACAMSAHYRRAWMDAGINCRVFEELPPAKAWVQTMLEARQATRH